MILSSPAILSLLAGLFALAAVAVLLRAGPERRLRSRVESLGLGRNLERQTTAAGPSIRARTREERPLLLQLATALGYNPEIPARYMLPLPAVVLAGAGVGILVFWRLQDSLGQLPAGLVGLLVTLAVVRLLCRRYARRYSHLLFTQIPDAISLVLRAVRAGLPVSEAIRNVSLETPSPTAEEFSRVAHETTIGVPTEVALWHLYERSGVKEYSFLAVTIGLQSQTGGNLAETLGNLADLVRRRVAMEAKVKAISAEGRASAAILVALPFVVMVVLAFIAPDYVGELLVHHRGPAFLFAFGALMSCGILVIRWMIQKATTD